MVQSLPIPSLIPNIPLNINNKVEFYKDVIYDDREDGKGVLDLYRAKSADQTTPKPCLIFIHGGSFVAGNKEVIRKPAYRQMILNCLKKGISVISMNYTLTNKPYDSLGLARPMNSIRDGLAHILKSADVLNIDLNNWGLMGTSAGAYAAQWFSMKEFGLVDGDPLLDISLMPNFAVSKEPNWTLNIIRIEEEGLFGEGVTLDTVLQDQTFAENAAAWYALDSVPTVKADLETPEATAIMEEFDPVHQNMFTPTMKPLYMIHTGGDDGEIPDTNTEYVHNKANPAKIYDAYTEQGVECYVWGTGSPTPIESLPTTGVPAFIPWLLSKFE